MPRRSSETYLWSFDPLDATSVPNARIVLALMRCVRRLPCTLSQGNYEYLGAALAPVLERHKRLVRATLRAHHQAVHKDLMPWGAPEGDFLQDHIFQTLFGEALARSIPRFRALFDKVLGSLESFVEQHAFSADRNLETLVRLIGLPAPETAFLRLSMAFCYGAIKRSIFDFVDSPSRIVCALETICTISGAEAKRLLDRDGLLARSCLLESLNLKRFRVDLDDLLHLSASGEALLSTPYDDEPSMARAVLLPIAPPADGGKLEWPHLNQQHDLLKTALGAALDAAVPGVNFLLHGPPGTGKTEFARLLVAEIDASGFVVASTGDKGGEASRSERLASLQLSQTFAGQTNRAVLVLDEAEDIFQNDYYHSFARVFKSGGTESKSWMNRLLENNPHPVIWISNQISHLDPAYLRRFSYCIDFRRAPLPLRRKIAQERLGAVGCSAELIESIATMPQVTPAHLDAAARFAGLSGRSGLCADVAVQSLIESHLRAGGEATPLDVTARRGARFDMRYLNVQGNATPQRVMQALEFIGARAGPQSGSTLLFSGPPGTGKTQFAAEIAERLSRQLVVRTSSDIRSKWYGESEVKVARMFRECDPRSEVLFLDEAEVLLGSREEASHRADRAVTAEFLRWLEIFDGIFVCATNRAASFDSALMRRFAFRLEFEPMLARQRVDLYAEMALGWRAETADARAPVDATTRSHLARLDQLTPGDFANAARRIRALGLPMSAWLDELEAEQNSKPLQSNARIGFV